MWTLKQMYQFIKQKSNNKTVYISIQTVNWGLPAAKVNFKKNKTQL